MSQRIFTSADFKDVPSRRGNVGPSSAAARVGSALTGLVLVAPALFLVMAGGARSYAETLQRGATQPVPAAILLMCAGLVLVLIVSLTGLFSALGPLVAGAVAAASGAAFVVNPELVGTVSASLPAVGASPMTLLVFWCQSGLLFCTGIVLIGAFLGRLVASSARAKRRLDRSTLRAVVSLVVAAIATPVGLVLVVLGSSSLLSAYGRASGLPAVDQQSLVLLVAGAATLGGVALTTGWSSVGVAVIGTMVLLLGLTAMLPLIVSRIVSATSALSSEFAAATATVIALGFVAVVGLVLIGAAASASRARRAASARR